MVREFDGVNDYIRCDNGAVSDLNRNGVDCTMLVVFQILTLPHGSYRGYFAAEKSSGQAGPTILTANNSQEPRWGSAEDDIRSLDLDIMTEDTWHIAAISKHAVAEAPRIHLATVGSAMDHGDGVASANATNLPITSFYFGRFAEGGGFPDMRLAVAAVWGSVLSDAALNGIASAKTTQSIFALGPAAMWEFNQASAATPVTDLTGGGADQTAIEGTGAVADFDPPGWTFGLQTEGGRQSDRLMKGVG